MERKEIEEKVRNFLIEDLEIDEDKIAPEAKLKDDLGIDSLDFVDIVVIVEIQNQTGRNAGGYYPHPVL